MGAKRRRNGTLLAWAGVPIAAVGLVALTVTDPVSSRDVVEPRVWALICTSLGLGLLVGGFVMRKTPAPTPPAKPRRYWLVLAGVGLVMLVGTAVRGGSADWTHYLPGAYLVVVSVGSWLYEYARARRGQGDRQMLEEEL